jgi:hypothetical protein
MANGEGKLKRGHAVTDFRPQQNEDVWRVLRDI